MVINGNDEQALANELANDLLDLDPESNEAKQFARWLFQTMEDLKRKMSGGGDGQEDSSASNAPAPAQTENTQQTQSIPVEAPTVSQDSEMAEASSEPGPSAMYVFIPMYLPPHVSQFPSPTGPKAMRNGSNGSGSGGITKAPRDKRMLNQMNRHLERGDDSVLHRIKNSSGTGRINSHASREPPKGPRMQQVGRGIAAMQNGRGMGAAGPVNMGGGAMNTMPGMGPGGLPAMPMVPPMVPGGANLNPQQQMALFQLYEQQAQMMQQLLTGQPPATHFNPNFQGGRGNTRHNNNNGQHFNKFNKFGNKQNLPKSTKFTKESQDENMTDASSPTATGGGDGAMDVDSKPRGDIGSTMCRFNLNCTKADCPFAHQSPAAPAGTTVDMTDTCSFGAACMNKKCAGKHPSPAQRDQHRSEVECAFYPNCRDMANCPYKHPTMPACRYGADCTVPGCKFAHSKIPCRFNPCTSRYCTYKHAEGQKKSFEDKVWVNPKTGGAGGQEHVSERKFVDEEGEEELIIPGKVEEMDAEIVT